MFEANADAKKNAALKWIKAESGNTYLCSVKDLKKHPNPTEDELKSICVDESQNPQND
jgi:hypothetical protein